MRNTEYFRNKKVTIVGLARSGFACANLLVGLGATVRVTDKQDNPTLRSSAGELEAKGIRVELGNHSRALVEGSDFVVISPGVTDDALPVKVAQELQIPVISEIEVAYLLCPATIIAVTGANGKTTVTTLIGKVLQRAGKKAYILGNIGVPFCQEVGKMGEGDFVSLEISSFQLEKIKTFRPKIAVILNFSRNHLDRYRDMDEYLSAKKRIFLNQEKSDYLVLNSEDSVLSGLAKEAQAKTVYFSKEPGVNPNLSAVLEVASILGIGREVCLEVFREFKGLEHRFEHVANIKNIKFINDSKATTVESAIWALRNIESPVILIAGGKDKGVDYRLILDAARNKIREVVLIGEARSKIKAALGGALPVEEVTSLPEAVKVAYQNACSGDCVLLSPMCSSFDMFKDYEERGRVFKEAVHALKEAGNS